MTDSEAIADLYVFRSVARSAIDELVALAPPQLYPAGSRIFSQGDVARHALMVIDGRLEASVQAGGRNRKLGEIGPGEVIGEAGIFSPGAIRTANVTTILPSRCIVITSELLVDAGENPAVMALETYLLGTLARRIRSSNVALMQAWKEVSPTSSVIETHAPTAASFLAKVRKLFGGTN